MPRTQVTVVELYDASPRDLSIESIILGRTQHAERLSSYSAMQLEVLSQSFYLQHSISGMGVSQTLQGITTKQLLLRTLHDQVGVTKQQSPKRTGRRCSCRDLILSVVAVLELPHNSCTPLSCVPDAANP